MFPSMGLLFQSLILFILGIFTNGIYNVGLFILTVIYALIILEFWSSLGILLSTKTATYQKRDVIMTLIFMPISYAAPTLYVLPKHPTLILKFLTSINPLTYQLNGLRSIVFGHFDGLTIGIGILITLAMLIYTQYVLKRMRLVLSERWLGM